MRRGAPRLSSALLALVIATVVSGSGCDGCSCSRLRKQYLGEAPNKEVKREIKRQLRSSRQVAEEMCGIPAKGLIVEEQTVEYAEWGMARVAIEARPILESGDGGAGQGGAGQGGARQGGARVDASKALLCTGVVLLSFEVVLDADDEMESIDFGNVSTTSVETPGVEFEPPTPDWD